MHTTVKKLMAAETIALIQENSGKQFDSLDDVVKFVLENGVDCLQNVPPQTRAELSKLCAAVLDTPVTEDCRRTWKSWRPLIADIFFFFEYYYEDGAGGESLWRFASKFNHRQNARIHRDNQTMYEQTAAIKDSRGVIRGEVLKTLAFDTVLNNLSLSEVVMTPPSLSVSFANKARFSLTNSQAIFRDLHVLDRKISDHSSAALPPPSSSSLRAHFPSSLVPSLGEMADDQLPRKNLAFPLSNSEEDERRASAILNLEDGPCNFSSQNTEGSGFNLLSDLSGEFSLSSLTVPSPTSSQNISVSPAVSPRPSTSSSSSSSSSSPPMRSCSMLPSSTNYGPMRNGEIVVRLFGMKNLDGLKTSHNILSADVSADYFSLKKNKSLTKYKLDTTPFTGPQPKNLRTHKGFWNMYQEINLGCLIQNGVDLVEHVVEQYLQLEDEFPETQNRRIVFTGHSMGAALASFAAFQLLVRYKSQPRITENVHLIIFGSPKFARSKFSHWLSDNLPGRLLLLKIQGDAITNLPPLVPGWSAPTGGSVIEFDIKNFKEESFGEDDDPHYAYWKLIRTTSLLVDHDYEFRKIETELLFQLLDDQCVATLQKELPRIRWAIMFGRDSRLQTGLHKAIITGKLDVVKFLIENRAPINELDENSWSPLHVAANEGHFEIVSYLIEKGADVSMRTVTGCIPMHYLAKLSYGPVSSDAFELMVNCMIISEVSIDSVNNRNETPLYNACKYGHSSTARYLSNNGASFTPPKSINGEDLLMVAVRSRRCVLVEYILQQGVDPDASYSEKFGTLLEFATAIKATEIVQILETYYSRRALASS